MKSEKRICRNVVGHLGVHPIQQSAALESQVTWIHVQEPYPRSHLSYLILTKPRRNLSSADEISEAESFQERDTVRQ